jgi:hypothetical protein
MPIKKVAIIVTELFFIVNKNFLNNSKRSISSDELLIGCLLESIVGDNAGKFSEI